MDQTDQATQIDFVVDRTNLYREESITDMKVGSIRRMVPITADGIDDTTRSPMFIGHTQLMSPEGPLPLQARLAANNFGEALEAFPAAMKTALAELMQKLEKMQKEQQSQQQEESRIIVPGR